jgi:hypothetical protein
MKLISKLLVAVCLLFTGFANAAWEPGSVWKYDGETKTAYIASKNVVDGKRATLTLTVAEDGDLLYVYYPTKQPKSCVGRGGGFELFDLGNYEFVGYFTACNKNNDKYRYGWIFANTAVEIVTDHLDSGTITIDGFTFTDNGLEDAASNFN